MQNNENNSGFSGFFAEMKNVFNDHTVKYIFRKGSDIVDAFKPYVEKPTIWNGAVALFNFGRALVDDAEIWAYDYFESDSWTLPFTMDFNSVIFDVVKKLPYKTIKVGDENVVIRIVDVEGIKAGWSHNTKLDSPGLVYVETAKLSKAREVFKNILWRKFNSDHIVMYRSDARIKIEDSYHSSSNRVQFQVDNAFNPLPSKKATEYSKYLKRCLDAGISRSVMLYGPPGTGKSTMARTIVTNLGLKSLRIRVEDIGEINNQAIFDAVEIFRPEAIIIDDFDRSSDQRAMYEGLEHFQRNVKLIISTVNHRDRLDEAIMRPGRIDELVLIDSMDEAVVKHMLGDFVDGFDLVKDWPIAFIQEYVKRRRFMSATEAHDAIIELTSRVNRLSSLSYRGDDDYAHLTEVLEKKQKKD